MKHFMISCIFLILICVGWIGSADGHFDDTTPRPILVSQLDQPSLNSLRIGNIPSGSVIRILRDFEVGANTDNLFVVLREEMRCQLRVNPSPNRRVFRAPWDIEIRKSHQQYFEKSDGSSYELSILEFNSKSQFGALICQNLYSLRDLMEALTKIGGVLLLAEPEFLGPSSK